jgi:hypothetical protein
MPRRCRNRPFRPNGFKQSYLARTDVVSVRKIETKPKVGIVDQRVLNGLSPRTRPQEGVPARTACDGRSHGFAR